VARAEDVDDLGDDQDALSWAGDEEQGRAAPRLREPESAVTAADVEAQEAPGSRGRSVATVAFLVPYLAITVGWIFTVQLLASGSASLFAEILWQFGEFLAMLAAPLWFAATLSLTKAHRPMVRVGWLALGLGVLVPWPLVLQFVAALQFAGGLS
jgi:hypothetical protein